MTSHLFYEKQYLHKKGRSKSVFQGGKGCKTSSGTHLAGADGHSTNKYCLAHQNTFLHHPHTNFSKCWLFLEKRSQLWWEAGTGKKSSRKMACTFKELGSAIFFLIKPKSETKRCYFPLLWKIASFNWKIIDIVIFASNSTTENRFNDFLLFLGWHKTEKQQYLS